MKSKMIKLLMRGVKDSKDDENEDQNEELMEKIMKDQLDFILIKEFK
jgi:hypothetical protein